MFARLQLVVIAALILGAFTAPTGSQPQDINAGGIGGQYNGAGDEIQNGDFSENSFSGVDAVNGGIEQGSGTFSTGSNGAFSGNTVKTTTIKQSGHFRRFPPQQQEEPTFVNFGGSGGSYNGAGDEIQNGDESENSFTDVGAVNGGIQQGSGTFSSGSNGGFSGNTVTSTTTNKPGHYKRHSPQQQQEEPTFVNAGGIGGSYNGAGDEIQNGDDSENTFEDVGEVNGGIEQGSGTFSTTNNGAYSGNTITTTTTSNKGNNHHRRSPPQHQEPTYVNYGGSGGSDNGAFDDIQNGDDSSNSFTDVGAVNGGIEQGSGTFSTGDNGAFSGNTVTTTTSNKGNNHYKRSPPQQQEPSFVNYGGSGGSYNGAGDVIQNGDESENSFNDVDQVNGGIEQGSGSFSTGSNGAFSGNKVTTTTSKNTGHF